ncbi:ANK REP REGION domain-containing protein [Citrus sinensis]|uniref:ANK REP REGION domain-containing protein n=1 Tax=Citrus sinensis TaxID=2711 RepID=A0ACB8I120_CITSI|nr:ANK REP REGION domain-containing protein [Citrus sinensis]
MEVNCLSKFAMRGQWDNFVQAYENNPMSREAKLTRSGDTALHIAAAAGQTNIVSELVEIMGENASNVLKIQNDRGDTALHLAAALGNEAMCHCMASKDRELISVRNNDSIAFQIMRAYADLVNSVNENGLTPLHILASKPNAFKSGSRLGLFDRIIYYSKTKGEADDKESPERSRSINLSKNGDKDGQFFPPNDAACVLFFRLLMKALLIVLGLVPETPPVLENDQIFRSRNISLESEVAVHNKDGNARDETATAAVQELKFMKKKDQQSGRKATPILIAAKMGVTEMVEKILDTFPVAIHDLDSEKKNLVLLAVENRQTGIYKLLLDRKMLGESDLSIFQHVDIKGNSALHLAAKFGEYGPWRIPGAALQMQWEIKWYKFVKESMPRYFFLGYNNKGKTPKEIFTKTHKELVKDGQEWLSRTSESCLVVAALIASVALTTSATVPGGLNEQSGKPILENEPAFKIFPISSFVALCFSMTALSFFLSILTSTYREKDFAMALPRKLLLGLTSLFTSISAIMISFCSGQYIHYMQQHASQ